MDNRKCALYRIVHRESGQDYVGISVNYKARWRQHKSEARLGSTSSPKFYNALRKYGPEAFDWKVIAWASCFSGACILEKMALHLGMGTYNCTTGGEGTPGLGLGKLKGPRSEETKKKISIAHTGKIMSAEARANMSLAKKGKPSPRKGTKVTCPETLARMSVASTGRPSPMKGKEFSQDVRDNMSVAALEHGHTESQKAQLAKLQESNRGKQYPEDHRKNISAAITAWHAERKRRALEESGK